MRSLRGGLLGALVAVAIACALATPVSAYVTGPGPSIEVLKSKLESDPNNIKIRYLLGRALSEKGHHSEAVTQFQAILAVKPVPAVMLQLGIELAKMGDLQNAVFQWDEIIKKYHPNNLTTLGYLGLALHKLASSSDDENRRFELHMSALDYFKRILRLDPGNVKACLYAAQEYMKLDKPAQAAKLCVRAFRADPHNIQALVLLTKVLWRLQKRDALHLVVKKILSLDASNVFAREVQNKLDKLSPKDAEKVDLPPPNPPPPPLPGKEDPIPHGSMESGGNSPPTSGMTEHDQPIPRPDVPAIPASGSQSGIQAEQLFLDGLDFKEKGNYEKALYSFLQAIDLDPKFSQVYLQIGEVYLALAKLAPTKNQFEERIQLAVQALKKVSELTPGSLLAHAAHAKEVLVTRLQKEGFASYHLGTAQKAMADERPEDAFEEYVLLLSNAVYNPEVFFDLGLIMPKLTGGNMQDLQFFLEELYGQHKENYLVEYLLSKTYARLGKVTEATAYVGKFVDHAEVLAPHIAKFVERTAAPKTDGPDLFIAAKLLLKRQDRREALTRLTQYLKTAKTTEIFYSEAQKLKASVGEILDAGMTKSFEDEKKEVLDAIARLKPLFGEYFKPEHLDDKLLEDLKVFLANHPENMLGKFMFAWVSRVQAPKQGLMQKDMEKTAEDTFNELLGQKTNSPDWHLSMGMQALAWALPDNARAHLKVAGDLLLLKARVRSSKHAAIVLEGASKLIDAKKTDEAAILLEQAHIFDSRSLNYYLVRYRFLMDKGRSADAMKNLVEMISVALGDQWFRLVLYTDVGLILFRSVLLALLFLSAMLVVRYFEDLHHLLSELWQQKGLLLPFSLAIAIFLVIIFPTGLVIFLPALTWPMLRSDEKKAFLLLLGLMILVPVILPLSLSDNFDLLRHAEQVRSGDITGAREFFEKFLKAHPGDYNATYLLAMVGVLEGDAGGIESSRKIFKDLSTRYPKEPGPIVNLGNLDGIKGDTTVALDAYNKALGKNPADARALFNISSIYARASQVENMEKYLRWARSVARGEEQLGRYEAASFNPPRLVLMFDPLEEEKLGQYFTMSGTFGLLSLDGPVVLFLCWFLFGGGLVGFLIFTRERLDVLMRRCHHCMRIVCNACQKVQDNKAFCVHCADEAGRKRVSSKDRNDALRAVAFKKAAAFNTFFPGSGLAFIGQAVPGCLVGLVFLTLALTVYSGGGWLANYLYQPIEAGPLNLIRLLLGLAAVAIYAGAQMVFFGVRSNVQG